MERKAVVAGRSFALGTGQGDFFFGDRVQKNREILAHRQKSRVDHLLRRGAHHHPVVVLHRQAQQSIAHRTTDHVNLHGASLQICQRRLRPAQPERVEPDGFTA